LIVLMGSGVSIAAQASVPGQALWPVKRSIEKAELTLTFSSVKETEIHIKHVNERMDEITKILGEENGAPEKREKKEKAIKQAVTHLQKDITAADTSLKIVKEENKTPLKVVELAKKVNDVAKETSDDLAAKKKQVEDNDVDVIISEALDDAQVVNKEVKNSAMKIALEVHGEILAANQPIVEESQNEEDLLIEGQILENMAYETSTPETNDGSLEAQEAQAKSESGVNKEDAAAVEEIVKGMLASEMDETSVEVENVKQKVGQVEERDIEEIKGTINLEQPGNLEIEDFEGIDQIEEQSNEAVKVLAEAKMLMEDGFLWDAYQKMYQVRQDYEKTDIILKQLIQAIAEHKTIDSQVIDQLIDIEPELQGDEIIEEPVEAKEFKASTIEVNREEETLVAPQ
jgi:hypothetical protein